MWFYSPPESFAGPFFEFGIGMERGTLNYSYSDPSGAYQFNGNFAPAPMVRIGFGNKIIFGGSGIFIEPRLGAEISTGSWNIHRRAARDTIPPITRLTFLMYRGSESLFFRGRYGLRFLNA